MEFEQYEDVTLGGVKITDLAETRSKVTKEAAGIISKHQKNLENIFFKLEGIKSEAENDEDYIFDGNELEALLKSALNSSKIIDAVSDASGVTYNVPFSEGWGYDEKPFSIILAELEYESNGNIKAVLEASSFASDLYRITEDMSWQSRQWHSSQC